MDIIMTSYQHIILALIIVKRVTVNGGSLGSK